MHWLIDGYNVIRRSPELQDRERQSLEAGRRALCELLGRVARSRRDDFTVVFDGAGTGGDGYVAGVRAVFSSARESADRVLARMAGSHGGAVVSSDREVRRAAARAGAIAITAEQFLARLEALPQTFESDAMGMDLAVDRDDDEPEAGGGRSKKGNPHRLGKKRRAAARALGRLASRPAGPLPGKRR